MTDPPTPLPAATILLLRDGPDGLETFMVVRHHQIDFASGALVFPGGKVDDGDFGVRDLCDGVDGASDTEVAMMAGAIREAFEESGVLLARSADGPGGGDGGGAGGALVEADRLAELERYRDPLNNGEIGLRSFLETEGLRLACDRLQRFAHWITPPMVPKRFDTQFYLAAAPPDHLAIHDGHESVDSVWITPKAAAVGADDGTYTIIFPTLCNIEMLGQSASVEAALADAANRTIVTVLPWTEQRDDGVYLRIPPEAGYAVSEMKMPERPGS